MIFEQSLRRELGYTTGAVFLVMLTIMLTTLVIRILGKVANGRANPADVAVLIGLATLGYLTILLTISLFIAILMVLTRWYKDSEMAVWFSSGISLTDFVRPMLRFSLPIVALIAVLGIFAWPWANNQSNILEQRFGARDDVALVAPGQFRESASANRVFFVESLSANLTRVHNVFITDVRGDKLGVVVAQEGRLRTSEDGDRYLILEHGRRYEGVSGKADYRVMEFDTYGVKVESPKLPNPLDKPARNVPTLELLSSPTPANQGELLWRVGLPITALMLSFLAIPLAYVNTRRGRSYPLVIAVLLYLIYSNMLNVVQAWVAGSKISLIMAWWPLHVVALALVFLLFAMRRSQTSWGQKIFAPLRAMLPRGMKS
ncbi:MAG: LPS export ABC transporter permease LptF [Candidatus Protistobacter heckmanni]|nr:LPS export ABC transporter permease LptF [Candidatus Protistobacter heckmanni]